jgi:hypothetical protein
VLSGICALAGLMLPSMSLAALADPRGVAGVPAVSANAVMRALGINPNPPAELVFLVDTSDSMQTGGLYTKVTQQLTDYFQTLAEQQPQDQVVVITIGQGSANELVYGPGAPPLAVGLPAIAHGGTTDFGAAFAIALDQLSRPPAGIKVGGLVLLSDGGMSAPHDPTYDGGQGYNAPGWAKLRQRAQGLSIPVTGYAVPLTANQTFIADQDKALSEVFSTVRTLPGGTTNLAGPLGVATQQVVYGEVASDTSLDSGQGIAVSWSGLPPGGESLNFRAAGHLTVKFTLTSQTQRVPLYVSGLHLDAPGLPVKLSVTPPATGTETLDPKVPRTFEATVTWQPQTIGMSLFGGPAKMLGHLVLTGTVGSSWTPALQSAFDDMTFTPGALHGATASFETTENTGSYFAFIRIALIVLVVLLVIAGLLALRSGSLILTSVDGRSGRAVLLPVFPVLVFGTSRMIGIRGRMTVRGAPLRRGMTIRLRLAGRPTGKGHMDPGGRLIVAGIDIVHRKWFSGSGYPPYERP